MPQYRLPGMGAGSAVGAGIGSGLSALGEMLFKQNAQARENELLMERQRAEQENAYKNAKLMASINDPFKAGKLGHPELGPTSTDIQKPISADINAADTENKLPTDEGIVNSIRSGGGQITNDPTKLTGGQVGVSTDDFIRQLTTRNSKAEGFKQSELDHPIGYDTVDANGVKQHGETTTGRRMEMGLLPTEPTPEQAASEAGAKSGAEAKARYPYESKLASTRANTALLNAQALDDYKKAHPAATSQQLNRVSAAGTALSEIGLIRDMLKEMDTRGMTGALVGRGADLAAEKIKSEQLFHDKDEANLAAHFFSSMKLLSSLAAVVHGGARGGGSPGMSDFFRSIVNGVGDTSATSGQLDSVEELMKLYHDKPDAPDNIPIRGYTPMPDQTNSPLGSARSKLSGR